MEKRNLLSSAALFLFFLIAVNSTYGQTYTSVVQSHMAPDGTSKLAYHSATVAFFNNNKNLKIFYKEFPNSPFIFTLEKINVRELSNKTGIVTQYRTIEDSNYSYINYSLVLVYECYKMMVLDEQYSYNLDVSIIQTKSDNSVEFMDKYYIKKEEQEEKAATIQPRELSRDFIEQYKKVEDGNGSSYQLDGRSGLLLPKPLYPGYEEGIVVVQITVDKNGIVTKVEPGIKGSNSANPELIAAARKAALQARFNPDSNASDNQVGTITYHFVLN